MTSPSQEYLTIPFPLNISIRQIPGVDGPCWEWTASRDTDGYGRIKVKRMTIRLPRLVYQLFVGDLRGLQIVMHRCDNPPCVNPSHLRLGTTADNMADRNRKFRQAFGIRLGSSKLNDGLVLALRRRYSAGEGSPKLAREVGVSTSTMQNVLFGRTWAHVPEACISRGTKWKKGR